VITAFVVAAICQQLASPGAPREASPATPPEVRAIVDSAAKVNFDARPYRTRATAETEIAIVARRASGRYEIVSVQQQASELEWTRDSIARQHIIGYRAEQVGLTFAMTRAYRAGWIVPFLSGDRIQLRLADPATATKLERALDPIVRFARRFLAEPETLATVHPLARDGWRFYDYPRVDTIRERTPAGDSVDLLRIFVRQRPGVSSGTSLFNGEVDVDARSLHLAHVRGRVEIVRSDVVKVVDATSDRGRVIALLDLWNAPEKDGYRLPAMERIDIVTGGVAGEAAQLVRFVTHFSRHEIVDPSPPPPDAPHRTLRYRVTYAPLDSQSTYSAWAMPVGIASREAQEQPLDDYYPDRMRPEGPPRFAFRGGTSYDVFRYNKVEGLFTGLFIAWYARDAMPGFSGRSALGYAWSEETWRGYVGAGLRRGGWYTNAEWRRYIDPTNDFRSPFDSGGVWSPLFWSSDNYDYVDRRITRLALEKALTPRGTAFRLEVGAARDAETIKHREKGMFFGPFRPNRIVDPGEYVRSIAHIEWNPDVQADLTRERFGGSLRYERADGDLDYQRTEAVVIARQDVKAVLLIGRLYGGAITGTVPTQQLFEIGSTQNLPGYDYKAFAGDRAWIARVTAQYKIPVLRSPFPFVAGFVIPAIAPEFDVGVQTGMAWASDDQARDAVRRLGDKVDEQTGDVLIDPETGTPVPLPFPRKRLRATASLGVRLLSGALYAGVALPIDATRDTRRALRLVFGFGRQL